MTIKARTAISWTARSVALLFLLLMYVFCLAAIPFAFLYALLILGIIATPPGVLSRNRFLARSALVLALLPVATIVCLAVGFFEYSSEALWHFLTDQIGMLISGVLTIGVCALPVALITDDALVLREKQIGDHAQETP